MSFKGLADFLKIEMAAVTAPMLLEKLLLYNIIALCFIL